jgi:molybdenum cofactor biosynthesis protein B
MSRGMIDISDKPVVFRKASAVGKITLKPETIETIKKGGIRKGDPLEAAKLAAIAAAKKTPELLTFCHPIPIDSVEVEFNVGKDSIEAKVTASAWAKTGVEMEALVGVTNALNTIWDMTKYLEKDKAGQYPTTRISDISVTEKVKLANGDAAEGKGKTHEKHKHKAPRELRIAVITVSTTRTVETDISGKLLKEIIEKNGHAVSDYAVVPDLKEEIAGAVKKLLGEGADAVIVNGGTGTAPADVTIEALRPLFTKEISAFGQLLAILSYREIGTAYANSRATAGIVDSRPVYCIPGSPDACRLAAEKLIMPEIGHTVMHARGG